VTPVVGLPLTPAGEGPRRLGRPPVGDPHRVPELGPVDHARADRRPRLGVAAQLTADRLPVIDVDPLADERRSAAPSAALEIGRALVHPAAQQASLEVGDVVEGDSHEDEILRRAGVSFPDREPDRHAAGDPRGGRAAPSCA
jgi:hypothetical protein